MTAFELADIAAPEVVFDTGRIIGVWSDGTTPSQQPTLELADVLQRLGRDPESMRQTIDRQSVQLTRIVDELLDVNRVARGRFRRRKR